jgi:SAM-dependent methyltransferase
VDETPTRVRRRVDGAALSEWGAYVLEEFAFEDYPAGARVLDIGTGDGGWLGALAENGCRAVGLDPLVADLQRARARGLAVVCGVAEHLPFRTAAADGVVCKVVMPYTDEARALAEIARVLRRGGRLLVQYHGLGYYARYVVHGPSVGRRLYGLRTIANTIVYRLTGRRLPGWLGDTIFQSRGRLRAYYERYGLTVLADPAAPKFAGLPVFIYHALERS